MEAPSSSAAMLVQPVQIPQRCVQSRWVWITDGFFKNSLTNRCDRQSVSIPLWETRSRAALIAGRHTVLP
jgi:hypothetical protein